MRTSVFPGAEKFIPAHPSFPVLRRASQRCRGCDLYLHASQAVFGEGSASAPLIIVGEQPGNDEDIEGRPFVGPAGKLLDKALVEAGIDRKAVYITNVVKHFKFEERGKRRLHKKPSTSEVTACRPWLEAEVILVKPKIIVCLGATAARALLGNRFRLTAERGKIHSHSWADSVLATIHPSAILRMPDPEARRHEYLQLVADFKKIRQLLKRLEK